MKHAIKKFFATTLVPLLGLLAPVAHASVISDDLKSKTVNLADLFAGGIGLEKVSTGAFALALLQLFLSMLGIIFLGLIVYGGYTWMTATGNEEKLKKAKNILRDATWGLLVTLSAYSITFFILRYLTAAATGAEVGGIP